VPYRHSTNVQPQDVSGRLPEIYPS